MVTLVWCGVGWGGVHSAVRHADGVTPVMLVVVIPHTRLLRPVDTCTCTPLAAFHNMLAVSPCAICRYLFPPDGGWIIAHTGLTQALFFHLVRYAGTCSPLMAAGWCLGAYGTCMPPANMLQHARCLFSLFSDAPGAMQVPVPP
jgi:hypothetical protein